MRVFLVICIFFLMTWIGVVTPELLRGEQKIVSVSPQNLEAHVKTLSEDFHPRNYQQLDNLNKTAEYIFKHFNAAGANTNYQGYSVTGKSYKNVVGVFNEGAKETIIIGAHYDSCADTPGADDNASGIAGLIELAYLFGEKAPNCQIELVAYTLEEPPFFGSKKMGSYQHASMVAEKGQRVIAAIVLEMIGYYSNKRNSQDYPSKWLNFIYPNKGNYIGLISNKENKLLTKYFKKWMRSYTDLPVHALNADASVPGIAASDHSNYWNFDIPALMVTDTAFYRNKAYHTPNDTADRLNYDSMAEVVSATYESVKVLSLY